MSIADSSPSDFAIGGSKRPGDTIYIQTEPDDTIVVQDSDGYTDEIITNDDNVPMDPDTEITEAGDNYKNSLYWLCVKILRSAKNSDAAAAISFKQLLELAKRSKGPK
jgi:hypothetical protein